MATPSLNKRFAELCELACEPTVDVVPDGWWTARDYAKAVSRSETSARRHLSKLLAQGKIQKRNFRIRGEIRSVVTSHYR